MSLRIPHVLTFAALLYHPFIYNASAPSPLAAASAPEGYHTILTDIKYFSLN